MLLNRYLSWFFVFGWMGVIFYLSSQPAFEVSDRAWLDNLAHIVAHLGVYAVLAGLIFNSLAFYLSKPSVLYGWTILTSFLYAVSDEWHQSMVPTRNPSVADLISDLAGILLVLAIIRIYQSMKIDHNG